ncbi:MAG: hypothetical protein V4819_01025 [Verrucomicrobiota bacterium]
MRPIDRAVNRYERLVDRLAETPNRHLFGIGDPSLECVRFYTFEQLSGNLDYGCAVELASDEVDEIERDLLNADQPYSLLLPLVAKLRSVSPRFNSLAKVVFLGSWGMGPGEIGWMIRSLNNRSCFEQYLEACSIEEEQVDAYNEACERDFKEAEQNAASGHH